MSDTFYVSPVDGSKVTDADVPAIKQALEVTLASTGASAVSSRPKVAVPGAAEDRQDLLHSLMGERADQGGLQQAADALPVNNQSHHAADTFLKNDVLSIQQSIVNREQRLVPHSITYCAHLVTCSASPHPPTSAHIQMWSTRWRAAVTSSMTWRLTWPLPTACVTV